MKKITVILAVRNEERFLPATMPSIYSLHPDEVIFGLDRCTDGTKKLIEAEAKRHPVNTRILEYGEGDGADWNFRRAFLRWDLGTLASNEVVVSTSGDIVLDPNLRKVLSLIPNKYRLITKVLRFFFKNRFK